VTIEERITGLKAQAKQINDTLKGEGQVSEWVRSDSLTKINREIERLEHARASRSQQAQS
jgi:hypothetical protein